MSATQRRLVTAPEQSLTVGVREASRVIGIGRDACYDLVREGRLRSISIGRSIRIPRSELEAFVRREAS